MLGTTPSRLVGALVGVIVLVAGALLALSPRDTPAGPLVTVYRPVSCGCCARWIAYLRDEGFRVEARDADDLRPINRALGVPQNLASCHTAMVGDYVVEGHVPAKIIRRLLRERPAATGVSVPGMPVGSPGMEGRYPEHYAVFLFKRGGKTTVYARY